jgi:hypothetical protein
MADLVIAIPGEVPRKYPVPDSFTYRELNTIKTVTGLRPAEFEDALASGDPDIVISLAVVCSQRAGHKITRETLLDLDVGSITIESDDDEDPTTASDEADSVALATIPADGGTPASSASTDSDPGN